MARAQGSGHLKRSEGCLLGTPSACREVPIIDGHAVLDASDQAVAV